MRSKMHSAQCANLKGTLGNISNSAMRTDSKVPLWLAKPLKKDASIYKLYFKIFGMRKYKNISLEG